MRVQFAVGRIGTYPFVKVFVESVTRRPNPDSNHLLMQGIPTSTPGHVGGCGGVGGSFVQEIELCSGGRVCTGWGHPEKAHFWPAFSLAYPDALGIFCL